MRTVSNDGFHHQSETQVIQFDLLSNARDSIRRAVDLLVWKDGSGSDHARLKHAVTSAAHAIELLLKERLRRMHPCLVWDDIDRYPSLEARTVTVDAAISRLSKIAGVPFSADDANNLRSLRKTRNAIEHYEWKTTEKEAKIIVGNALSFALNFSREQLGTDLADDFKSDDTWTLLVEEMYDFACAHGRRISERLRLRGDVPFSCDSCGQDTIPSRGGSCELCGHWQEINDDEC